MSEGPEAAPLKPPASPAAPSTTVNAATAASSAPSARATPAINELVSLFDELADRHISANIGNPKAPFGITREMLADFRNRATVTRDELAQLARDPEEGMALARRILRDRVWEPMLGDKIPAPLASAAFDIALRRGLDRYGKTMQKVAAKAAGAALKIDGYLGQEYFRTIENVDADDLAERLLAHRGTLVWRLGDGKILGHDVNLARAAIFAGKWALRAKGIPLP